MWISHSSPVYEGCQTQSNKGFGPAIERVHPDYSNNNPQPMYEFQVRFLFYVFQDKPEAAGYGKQETRI